MMNSKVCNHDTTIQPEEKEGQFDVSSSQKGFHDQFAFLMIV